LDGKENMVAKLG